MRGEIIVMLCRETATGGGGGDDDSPWWQQQPFWHVHHIVHIPAHWRCVVFLCKIILMMAQRYTKNKNRKITLSILLVEGRVKSFMCFHFDGSFSHCQRIIYVCMYIVLCPEKGWPRAHTKSCNHTMYCSCRYSIVARLRSSGAKGAYMFVADRRENTFFLNIF